MQSDELMHFGVKGMKWGVRRYQNKDGSLTDKGIKKYAVKGYAKDSYNSNKTVIGKAFDRYSGAHKTQAKVQYDLSSKKTNEARAKKYLSDKQEQKQKKQEQKQNLTPEQKAAKTKKAIAIGASVTGTALATYGAYKVNQFAKKGLKKQYYDVGADYAERFFEAYRKANTESSMIKARKLEAASKRYFDISNSGKFTAKEKFDYISDVIKSYKK